MKGHTAPFLGLNMSLKSTDDVTKNPQSLCLNTTDGGGKIHPLLPSPHSWVGVCVGTRIVLPGIWPRPYNNYVENDFEQNTDAAWLVVVGSSPDEVDFFN
jgi:hypothetical protein